MRGGREEEEKGEEAAARQEVECGGLAQPAPSRPRWRREKNICICVTSPRVCVHRLVRRLHSINRYSPHVVGVGRRPMRAVTHTSAGAHLGRL